MEYRVRSILNVQYLRCYAGENLKIVMLKNILNSRHVLNNWDIAVGDTELESKEKEKLLKLIATLYGLIFGVH